MEKEYGGYIEFEYFHGEPYHSQAVALNSGRHCLAYLIKAKGITKLFIPYYLCGSIKNVCDDLNVQVEYYHIDAQLMPIIPKTYDPSAWLYVVNYYGQLTDQEIQKFKKDYPNLIIDNAQAFFQMPVEGVDTFYTCRKFFGVADGGYLYTDAELAETLEKDYSYDRMEFLLGRMEKSASEFYPAYVENNAFFSKEPIKEMSATTDNIMHGIDYDSIKKTRTENFQFLHEKFGKINLLQLNIPEGAFMYPLLIKNGSEIRERLIRKKIYIPLLWPDVLTLCKTSDWEYNLADNLLLLPVDQRYKKTDMAFIAQEVQIEF